MIVQISSRFRYVVIVALFSIRPEKRPVKANINKEAATILTVEKYHRLTALSAASTERRSRHY